MEDDFLEPIAAPWAPVEAEMGTMEGGASRKYTDLLPTSHPGASSMASSAVGPNAALGPGYSFSGPAGAPTQQGSDRDGYGLFGADRGAQSGAGPSGRRSSAGGAEGAAPRRQRKMLSAKAYRQVRVDAMI